MKRQFQQLVVRTPRPPPRRRRMTPRVEALEDRGVPAIVVNTLDDPLVEDNPRVTTLREVIADANNQAGDDVITFHPGARSARRARFPSRFSGRPLR